MNGRIIPGKNGKPDRYYIGDTLVSAKRFNKEFPDKPIGLPQATMAWQRPLISDAFGVHPDQIDEAEADALKKGVPLKFVRHGENAGSAVFNTRGHRKQVLEAYGRYDRNGGTGDPEPGKIKDRPDAVDPRTLY